MTLAELRQRWEHRRHEWAQLGVSVSGEAIAREVLADIEALGDSSALEPLTLRAASRLGGYSVDRLQKLVAAGQLENVGRKGRPRIRRADVPVKPGFSGPTLPRVGVPDQFSARRRIVASLTHPTQAEGL